MGLYVSGCASLFSSYALLIFMPSLRMHLWILHFLFNFLPCCLPVYSKPHHLAFAYTF